MGLQFLFPEDLKHRLRLRLIQLSERLLYGAPVVRVTSLKKLAKQKS